MPSCPRIVCLPLMTKAQLKPQSRFEHTFYLDHYCTFFFRFLFKSSKTLTVFVMAALINWVEIRWGATGDTGTVMKLGQCQTPQPWLPLFLSVKHVFYSINPVSLFISRLRPFSSTFFVHHFSVAPYFQASVTKLNSQG